MHYDIEDEPMIISKAVMDVILKEDNPGNIIALYVFYYYTAKWQNTNTIRATNNYAAKGLKWGEEKVLKNKGILKKLGLVEGVCDKDIKSKKIIAHYVKINFICNCKKPQPGFSRAWQKPGPGKSGVKCLGLIVKCLETNKETKVPKVLEDSKFFKFSKTFHTKQKQKFPKLIKTLPDSKIINGANELEKLERIDKFDFDTEIKPTLIWATKNDFWSKNVLSLSSIRNKSKTNDEIKFVNIMVSRQRDVGDDLPTQLKEFWIDLPGTPHEDSIGENKVSVKYFIKSPVQLQKLYDEFLKENYSSVSDQGSKVGSKIWNHFVNVKEKEMGFSWKDGKSI